MLPKRILPLAFLLLMGLVPFSFGQKSSHWGFKLGLNFTNQVYSNIPTKYYSSLTNDTITIANGGGYNRKGISFLLYREVEASKKVHLLYGVGYRQRGFLSDQKYNRHTTGYVNDLPKGQESNNRFDNLYLDFAVKLRRDRGKKIVPFLLVGNRLDGRIHFSSDFWGTDYTNLTRFEISPFFSGGVEFVIPALTLARKDEYNPTERFTRLTIEFEFNPGIMNVHSGDFGGLGLSVSGTPIPNPYGSKIPVEKEVKNQSFGVNIGLRF